jgi:uncharacterized protein
MLLRFYVSNFLSFSEEVEINMLPQMNNTRPEHLYQCKKVDMLKAAAIYGANGSGKSNLVKAVHFLHDVAVKESLSENEIDCVPFRLDAQYVTRPSVFGIEFYNQDKFFEYIISISNGVILTEELYQTFPTKSEATIIFSRKTKNGKSICKVNPDLLKSQKERLRYEIYQEDLAENQSFLFKVKDKLKEAEPAFNWFSEQLWIIYPYSKYFLTLRLCFDEKYKHFLNSLLPKLNTGLDKIDILSTSFEQFFSDSDEDQKARKHFEESLKNTKVLNFTRKGIDYVARVEGGKHVITRVKTYNKSNTGQDVEFEPTEQSDGSQRMLDLIPAIHMLTSKPCVFIIDEIDQSLHPLMTKTLVRHFMDHPAKGQLLFTTHEANLLDLEIFRQDEVWLTEKKDAGETALYSLSDFKPRKDLDVRKGYLAGRFGAIPFLGNLTDLNWNHAQKQIL